MSLYTIIEITDQELKNRTASLCHGQAFIGEAPMVLLFAADFKKWNDFFHIYAPDSRTPGLGDMMLAWEDSYIAMQNAVTAAWALGIGSCYIGDILENYEFHKELLDLPDYVVPISLVCLGYYKEGHKRVHRKRFDQKYVVFEEKYRELSDEELKEMFAERAAGFVKTPTSSAENFAQAFYRRKTGAAFSKEMKRSVRAMLADYTKESC